MLVVCHNHHTKREGNEQWFFVIGRNTNKQHQRWSHMSMRVEPDYLRCYQNTIFIKSELVILLIIENMHIWWGCLMSSFVSVFSFRRRDFQMRWWASWTPSTRKENRGKLVLVLHGSNPVDSILSDLGFHTIRIRILLEFWDWVDDKRWWFTVIVIGDDPSCPPCPLPDSIIPTPDPMSLHPPMGKSSASSHARACKSNAVHCNSTWTTSASGSGMLREHEISAQIEIRQEQVTAHSEIGHDSNEMCRCRTLASGGCFGILGHWGGKVQIHGMRISHIGRTTIIAKSDSVNCKVRKMNMAGTIWTTPTRWDFQVVIQNSAWCTLCFGRRESSFRSWQRE